jgi:hypothetical protein
MLVDRDQMPPAPFWHERVEDGDDRSAVLDEVVAQGLSGTFGEAVGDDRESGLIHPASIR